MALVAASWEEASGRGQCSNWRLILSNSGHHASKGALTGEDTGKERENAKVPGRGCWNRHPAAGKLLTISNAQGD